MDWSDLDPHSSLFSMHDAIHGPIDLRDTPGASASGTILRLLHSPMVERLRRVKQLGYASHQYPAADHSRFAHAVGTMHVMRTIFNHLTTEKGLPANIYKDLRASFREAFPTSSIKENQSILARHMLVAALIQDVGELPYSQATSIFCKPSERLRDSLSHSVGVKVDDWLDKDIFTVALIHDRRHSEVLRGAGLDLQLLVFLITGHLVPTDLTPRIGLRVLRHLLDGEVDADRIDYVFRDARLTVGGLGTPDSVIESLLYYDELGPVFSETGPVSEFLITRASLWTTVYFSPQNRFRTLLLITLLKGIMEVEDCKKSFFDGLLIEGLSLEDFEQIDDISLTAHISQFYDGKKKNRLCAKARNALDILVGQGPEYQCFWIPPPTNRTHEPKALVLPDELFFDTYANYQDHSLYQPGSIRIKSTRFRYVRNPIPLEECSGAFSAVFRRTWSALPMPGYILLLTPKDVSRSSRTRIEAALEAGALYEALIASDPLNPIDFPVDTTKLKGFNGPKIFISFTWADIDIVRKIVNVLHNKRRKYYLLSGAYQGLGSDAGTNSISAVNEAEAVLVLASVDYVARYAGEPNGNIAREIIAMTKRVTTDDLKIIFLSADSHREIAERLPYTQLGLVGTPFVGEPLRKAGTSKVKAAVEEALKEIDEVVVRKARKK